MLSHDKTPTGLQRWFVDYERECEYEAVAHVHYPIKGHSSMRVQICDVPGVALDPDHEDAQDGDMVLVREGEYADRLEMACSIVHVPDMLDALRTAVRKLEDILGDGEVTDDSPIGRTIEQKLAIRHQLGSDPNYSTWCYLMEIQRDLETAAENATNTELI